jgi:hypothetical protein
LTRCSKSELLRLRLGLGGETEAGRSDHGGDGSRMGQAMLKSW